MERLLIVLSITLVLLSACAGPDDPVGAPPVPTSEGVSLDGGESAPEPSVAPPVPPTVAAFAPSTDDPAYVDLILDCVYGENEAGSCERFEAAGLDADDDFGLGNGIAETTSDALRTECLQGVALACGELNFRVAAAVNAGDADLDLLCLFHAAVRTGVGGSDLDLFHLGRLVGSDAPVDVVDAIARLTIDRGDADALGTVTGYLDPMCPALAD